MRAFDKINGCGLLTNRHGLSLYPLKWFKVCVYASLTPPPPAPCQVLVVNQVTTQIKREDTSRPPSSHSDHVAPTDGQLEGEGEAAGSRVAVALGNTWAHQVNTRLVMEFLTNKLRKVSCYLGNHPATIFKGGGGGRASSICMMYGLHSGRGHLHGIGCTVDSVLGSTVVCCVLG